MYYISDYTYSKKITELEWGYNRDKESLQIAPSTVWGRDCHTAKAMRKRLSASE